jgi:hypothetical protein
VSSPKVRKGRGREQDLIDDSAVEKTLIDGRLRDLESKDMRHQRTSMWSSLTSAFTAPILLTVATGFVLSLPLHSFAAEPTAKASARTAKVKAARRGVPARTVKGKAATAGKPVTAGAAENLSPTDTSYVCSREMDVGAAVRVTAVREGAYVRLNVEPPVCAGLKIIGVWRALELTEGKRQLTGKVRGLSGPYEKGESALIGINITTQNPFLEPGDAKAMNGALLIKGTLAVEYQWAKASAPPKKKTKRGAKAKSEAEPTPTPVSNDPIRTLVPVSIQIPAQPGV